MKLLELIKTTLFNLDVCFYDIDSKKVIKYFEKIDTNHFKYIIIEIKSESEIDFSICYDGMDDYDMMPYRNHNFLQNSKFYADNNLFKNFKNKFWLEFDYKNIMEGIYDPLYFMTVDDKWIKDNLKMLGLHYNLDFEKYKDVYAIGKAYRTNKRDERLHYKYDNTFCIQLSNGIESGVEQREQTIKSFLSDERWCEFSHQKDSKSYWIVRPI